LFTFSKVGLILCTGVVVMTLGQKIKTIRTFRGITQKQLGTAMGFNETNADVRVRQYEQNGKIPRENNLDKLAKALNVSRWNFIEDEPGSASSIMQILFWHDELNPTLIKLATDEGDKKSTTEKKLLQCGSENRPANSPTVMWFNNNLVDEFMREWAFRKAELKSKQITRDEYFEWKLNWPHTCDDCGKIEPKFKWREITDVSVPGK